MVNSPEKDLYISIRGLTKRFSSKGAESVTVLDDFSLDIKRGEVVSLFGPNGCGKTTLFNLIVGLIKPDEGSISIDFSSPLNKKSSLHYAFQNFSNSLFPWRSVIDNIALKFEIDGVPKRKRIKMVRVFAEEFGVSLPWDAFPYQLSGGQQQMVALLRALVYRPNLCLMDEPLSAFDYQNVLDVIGKMSAEWQTQNATVLLVSHDIEQAIFFADRVVVLTRRPMRAKMSLRVPFKKPRTLELLESEDFFNLRTQALKAFVEEVSS